MDGGKPSDEIVRTVFRTGAEYEDQYNSQRLEGEPGDGFKTRYKTVQNIFSEDI